jgi:hypothetical protein
VLYQNGVALWNSGTPGQNCGGQCFAAFQGDGNFVVYDGPTAIWNSRTGGNPGTQLVLSSQSPHIQIIGSNQSIFWADSYTFRAGTLVLPQGASVNMGSAFLVMQGDGLYQNGAALWSSQTAGQMCGANQCLAAFQGDGNFVIYNGSTAIWTSNTAGNPGAQLMLSTQSPHIQIMGSNQSILWQDHL